MASEYRSSIQTPYHLNIGQENLGVRISNFVKKVDIYKIYNGHNYSHKLAKILTIVKREDDFFK